MAIQEPSSYTRRALDFFTTLGTLQPLMAGYRKRPPRKKRKKKTDAEKKDGAQEVSKGFIEMDGVIEEALPAASFRIKLSNGQMIHGHLSGKMRMFRIRLLPGDEVKVEMTPYDLTKGRIVFRY